MLLAIDTSAGSSVAVVADDRRILAERDEAGTRRHAETIGPLIRDALADAGIPSATVTAVVAGIGPGPFTGLRVGIAAARAFAHGLAVPLLSVVSHDAVAMDRDRAVLVVTDARRREVAWSVYEPGLLRRRGPELARPDDLPEIVPGYDALERIDAARIPAAQLALAALLARREGRDLPAPNALYLRAPDVTVAS